MRLPGIRTIKKPALIVSAVLLSGAIAAAFKLWPPAARSAQEQPGAQQAPASDIVVRGRIEPASRVLSLQGPSGGGVIKALQVTEGQQVERGQILALLEGYDVQRAALDVAERALQYSQMLKEQALSSAKKSEISAQESVVAAKHADLIRQQREMERQNQLFATSMISQQALDRTKSDLALAEMAYRQAQSTLASLAEVRSVDKSVAIAKVAVDAASVEKAKAELERMIVRAPIGGKVLSIFSRTGEAIGNDGILRMAALDKLAVIAEVDEHFVTRLNGQTPAVIEGALLAQPVPAKIKLISHEIFKQSRPNSDTLLGRDARIVEVELEPQGQLPTVLGGEVAVRFSPRAARNHVF